MSYAVIFAILLSYEVLAASSAFVFVGSQRHTKYAGKAGTAGEDEEGWGGVCESGKRQSPVDLTGSTIVNEKEQSIKFIGYNVSGKVTIENTGTSFDVFGFDQWPIHPSIHGSILNGTYLLNHFHMHYAQGDHPGSEHRIHGKQHTAELHLVHTKAGMCADDAMKVDGGVVVLGVMLDRYALNSRPLSLYAHIFQTFQHIKKANATYEAEVLLEDVLPRNRRRFYNYKGSLTTPPCSEVVNWIVFEEPVAINEQELASLQQLHGKDGALHQATWRQTKPLNHRHIIHST